MKILASSLVKLHYHKQRRGSIVAVPYAEDSRAPRCALVEGAPISVGNKVVGPDPGPRRARDACAGHTTTKELRGYYGPGSKGRRNCGAECNASGTHIDCSFEPSAAMLYHECCGLPRGQQVGWGGVCTVNNRGPLSRNLTTVNDNAVGRSFQPRDDPNRAMPLSLGLGVL